MWHQIVKVKCDPSGDISAEGLISPESQWFSGHFPGQPILPGIAQLAMVRETVSRGAHEPVTGCDFSRVKFKKMITPGERLTIVATPKKNPKAYSFRILVEDEVVASGNLNIKMDDYNTDKRS